MYFYRKCKPDVLRTFVNDVWSISRCLFHQSIWDAFGESFILSHSYVPLNIKLYMPVQSHSFTSLIFGVYDKFNLGFYYSVI